ncbi:MBL fold metallo-hydrolase [Microtetraspora sp. NBRC 16547]|uniref:MBL fold metallo-hydrolase n=1 Tax=Microtetraspora sp. NBRC 16547 TaxID=3030993 RepID=UPI0024A446AE|nr:MBL fold metallo-hydrolase [Microtetraspora sp. NBRC 16547]GLX02872.1 MBL fold metallo-hydrolase [Microtetraspora sp. NBRC 16547]
MTILEQPDDWTEPGAHPVRPGVHRVPLPLPSNGLHAVNAYVIESPEGPVVVDSGWAMPDTEKALAEALRTLGHRLADVACVLVTHAHWDHYSQALALRGAFGTRVRIGRGERPSIEAFDLEKGLYPRQVELLRRCGAAEIADHIATEEISDYERDVPWKLPDGWLDDGERVSFGPVGLDVFATPGHTRGHVVLRDAAAGLLFAGDHVLPHITPSLGLEVVPDPKPLRSYLDSLRLVRGMPDTLLLPAHGPVTPSVHTRVEELLVHHEQRLDATLHAVRSGAGTAYEVALALPWTRRRRTLDDLDLFSQMLAVLETDAHLDLLTDQGVLVAADLDGVRAYAPS